MSGNSLTGLLSGGLSLGANTLFPGLGALGSGALGGLGASLLTGGNRKKHLTIGLTSALSSHFGAKYLGKHVANLAGLSGIPGKLLGANVASALGSGLAAMYTGSQFDALKKIPSYQSRNTYTPQSPNLKDINSKANFKAMYYAKKLKLLENAVDSKGKVMNAPQMISQRESNPWAKSDPNFIRHLSELHYKNQR